MAYWSCEYNPNAHPWDPVGMTAAAKKAVKDAGGTVTWTNPQNKFHFIYKCDSAAISGAKGKFKNQIFVTRTIDKKDQEQYEAEAKEPDSSEVEVEETDGP